MQIPVDVQTLMWWALATVAIVALTCSVLATIIKTALDVGGLDKGVVRTLILRLAPIVLGMSMVYFVAMGPLAELPDVLRLALGAIAGGYSEVIYRWVVRRIEQQVLGRLPGAPGARL